MSGIVKRGIFIITAALIVITLISAGSGNVNSPALKKEVIDKPRLNCLFYNEKDFRKSVSLSKPMQVEGSIAGGIVPHHLLADGMIADFFAGLSGSEAEIMYIIAPNHKRTGQSPIHTGSWDWQTPFGVVGADKDIVDILVDKAGAAEDFNLMENEHSIAGLIPYVKYYLPEIKVVPVLLHGNLSFEASKKLADVLDSAAENKKWIAAASIDFSHYLTPEAADEMDKITIKAIQDKDFAALCRMGNDNLDSPPSAVVFLELMMRQKADSMILLGHSNSSRITGVYSSSTTSYFTLYMYK